MKELFQDIQIDSIMSELFQDIHIDSIMTCLRQINLFNKI